jgi:hypothetical protein
MVLKQIQEAPLLATEMLQVAEIVGQLVLNTAWGLCKDAYVCFFVFCFSYWCLVENGAMEEWDASTKKHSYGLDHFPIPYV